MHGRSGTNAKDQYHVSECKTRRISLDGGGGRRREFIGRFVHYEGMVYCATVPNGTLIVRRRGQAFIAGNCVVMALAAARLLNPNLRQMAATIATLPIPTGVPAQVPTVAAPQQQARRVGRSAYLGR